MPYLATAEEWLHQSALLLEARPETARITTKYSIKTLKSPPATKAADDSKPPPPVPTKGTLVLKTFDPVSGVCLKHSTEKAADVGRLIAALGRLGRAMAGLPPGGEEGAVDAAMPDAPAESDKAVAAVGVGELASGAAAKAGGEAKAGPAAPGGKKKKKGKR
ncbi:MAG: hypothetical protein M1829_004286 [Trizodia sp. TS-e1964]|nr:MAG: hypothetical protein M1829_004286 [Trizodia sp. TS-e1964]